MQLYSDVRSLFDNHGAVVHYAQYGWDEGRAGYEKGKGREGGGGRGREKVINEKFRKYLDSLLIN